MILCKCESVKISILIVYFVTLVSTTHCISIRQFFNNNSWSYQESTNGNNNGRSNNENESGGSGSKTHQGFKNGGTYIGHRVLMPELTYYDIDSEARVYKKHKFAKERKRPHIHKTVDVIGILNETVTGQFAIEFLSVSVLGKLIIDLIVIAGLEHRGIKLLPATLPFFILPIGLLALSLFIPIFAIVLPYLVVAGQEGIDIRKYSSRSLPHSHHHLSLSY